MDEEDKHSPSEFYNPEFLETFAVETETGITEYHIINNLLTELAWAVLGNIGQWSGVGCKKIINNEDHKSRVEAEVTQ